MITLERGSSPDRGPIRSLDLPEKKALSWISIVVAHLSKTAAIVAFLRPRKRGVAAPRIGRVDGHLDRALELPSNRVWEAPVKWINIAFFIKIMVKWPLM
jgi:hypothetical protein